MNEGGAVKPDPHGNAEVGVQDGPHIFRVHPLDVDRQQSHMIGEIFRAVGDPVNPGQTVTKPAQEFHFPVMDGFDASRLRKVDTLGKADDAQQIESTGLQSVGKGLGVDQASGINAGATETGGLYSRSRIENQASDARRTEHGLVTREGHPGDSARPPCR